MQQKLPVIGVTMGDPAGIGPEIVCKCLAEAALYEACLPVVIGSLEPMERAAALIGAGQRVRVVEEVPEEGYGPGEIFLFDVPLGYTFQPGVLQKENGAVSIRYMEKAYELLSSGALTATASAPCNKEAMKLAGSPYTGATELFAHFAGDVKTSTVVEQGGCYVFQFTTHLSLRKALEKITRENVEAALLDADCTLKQWGFASPRLALSAVNPHAGDGGLMGDEEIEILEPALRAAREKGVSADGPVPADSIYIKGMDGVYDGIIMLFHDTANIPIKLMGATKPSVVITAGLPFIRATVAHGTAYDIAYKNIAGHGQMKNCILASARIGQRILERQ